ncbi:MAG: GAF domain-containing protein [Haloarculaceae archaeon]
MRATILCVDGDGDRRSATVDVLSTSVSDVVEAADVEGSRETLRSSPVDCIVTEYDLPDGTGMDVADAVREHHPDAGCVLYTATPHHEVDTSNTEEVVVEFVPRGREGSGAELATLVESLLRMRTHTAYPVPTDESDRIAAVEAYRPVADDASDALDRLTDIAAAHFGTSLTFVTLMFEHEQLMIEQVGEGPTVLPREDTVCTYALLEDGVTVIEDLAADPLFEANEALGEAGLRFYAGTKLVSPDGHVVGTFCVMDDEPRSFSEAERSVLAALGEETMEQLELRRRLAARTEVGR